MKRFFTITLLCLCISMFGAHKVYSKRYKAIDSEKMMKLKELHVFGINLTMTMGEIITTLEKQGIKLECNGGGCQLRTEEFNIRVQHKRRSPKPQRRGAVSVPVDHNAFPISINFGYVKDDPKICASVYQAVKIFCSDGVNEHPCWKEKTGKIQANLAAVDPSSDGLRYSGTFVLYPQKFCGINMKAEGIRKQMVLPAGAQDNKTSFMKHCTTVNKLTPSFCECSLKAISNSIKTRRTEKIALQEMNVNGTAQGLLTDPALTQDKMDAVCDLHDLAAENNVLAALNWGSPESRKYTQKKLGLLEQKKSLVESYKPNSHTAGSLLSGNYCDNRAKLIIQKQDLAKSNDPKNIGQLYPEVERILAYQNSFSKVISAGDEAGCPR